MKILVLSDTHGVLRPEVREMLGKCDAVIHGGDFHTQAVMQEILRSVAADVPVFQVRGNNDGSWAADLPDHLELALNGVKFYVVHDRGKLPKDLGDCQVAIFGHSHKYLEEWKDGRLYLNPGSCGRRRFRLDLTMAVLYLEKGKISVERVDIFDGNKRDNRIKNTRCENAGDGRAMAYQGNMLGMIQDVMKRMDKGQKIERISRELHLERDFAEEICRIRVTHPGVSAEGILNKIEVNNNTHRF